MKAYIYHSLTCKSRHCLQTIRICDFGMARFLGEQPGMLRNSMSRMTRHNVGTLAYAAPEILKLADNAEVHLECSQVSAFLL